MNTRIIANTPAFYLFDLQKVEESQDMIFGADYVLIQPVCDGCTLHLADSEYLLSASQAVLLAPFNPFRLTCDSRHKAQLNKEYNILHFRLNSLGQTFVDSVQFKYVREMLEESRRGILFSGDVVDEIRVLINQMKNTLEFSNVINFLSLLDVLSHAIIKNVLLEESMEVSSAKKNEERLQVALDYIERNLSEPLSVAIVSDQVHMAESTFSRFFHANKGVTFKQYLIEQRVRQAGRLLVTTDWSIAQISTEVGFSSLSNFNAKFKTLLRVTPKKYRQAHIDMRSNIDESKAIEGQVQRQFRRISLASQHAAVFF